jgi:hypothetical protein
MGQVVLFWVAIVAGVAAVVHAIYAALQYHRGVAMQPAGGRGSAIPKFPYGRMLVLVLLAWGAVAFDYYYVRNQEYCSAIIGHELTGKREGSFEFVVTIDGACVLQTVDPGYQIAVIAYHFDRRIDERDIANLQKSMPRDIVNRPFDVMFSVSEALIRERQAGAKGIIFSLLAIPEGVRMDQFSTIREAEALGVLWLGGEDTRPVSE